MAAAIGAGPSRPPRNPGRPGPSGVSLAFIIAVLTFAGVVYARLDNRDHGSRAQNPTAPAASTSGTARQDQGRAASWRQVFLDGFTGAQLDPSKWTPYGGQPSGRRAGEWSSAHDVVRNGELVIRGYREPGRGNAIVTGGVSSAKAVAQTYGKYLIRMRMDAGRGVSWVALLWPADNHWPPEVDFGEDNGAGDRRLVYATQHYSTPAKLDTQVQVSTRVDMTAWHTIGVEWSPGTLRYTLDGAVWATTSNVQVSSRPMVLDLQTQAWGCLAHRWEQCADHTTPAEVDLHVDWVAAYARSG